MNRDEKFGRLLAIANVVGGRVFEPDRQSIANTFLTKYGNTPVQALGRIHHELMKSAERFGEVEIQLMDQFGEIMATLDESEFTNEPLNPQYLHGYYSHQHVLSNIMGTEEAAKRWNITQDHVKRLCREGKAKAVQIGKTWILDKNQPKPKPEPRS